MSDEPTATNPQAETEERDLEWLRGFPRPLERHAETRVPIGPDHDFNLETEIEPQ